jgi:hypothetical protein
MRQVRTRTAAAAFVAALFLAARGDEGPDVDERIDRLANQLAAPEAAARRKALDALRAMGDAAIEPLLRKAGDEPGTPVSDAALAALETLDPDEALARVETSRTLWEPWRWTREIEGRKGQTIVDLLVEKLLAARRVAWSKSVPLETAVNADGFRVPSWAERRIVDQLPSELVWAEVKARTKGASLELDVAGDGRFSTHLDGAKPQVLSVGPGDRARKVLVQRRLDAWYAASPHVARAVMDGSPVELLDVQGDGAFDGDDDLIRFGDGAFRPLREGPFGWTPKGLVRFRLRREGGALTISSVPEPSPRWMDAAAAAGMDALNAWRNAAGLAPHRIDETRWKACGLHHEYWNRNGFSAHDEDASKPGWTTDGAKAGQSSSVWQAGDARAFVARIGGSILHRSSLIGRPSEGVGFYAGNAGSLLWGATIEGISRNFPIAIPGPGQTDVLWNCESEMPFPPKDPAFYSKARGFPVSVTWSGLTEAPVAKRRIDLIPEGAAAPLPGRTFSAEDPYHPDYRNGYPDDSTIFVSDAPLAHGTTYVVRFRADGASGPIDVSWRFRTK